MFWVLKKMSHREGSFGYPKHMFWLRNKKNNFQLPTLMWGPAISTDNQSVIYFTNQTFALDSVVVKT